MVTTKIYHWLSEAFDIPKYNKRIKNVSFGFATPNNDDAHLSEKINVRAPLPSSTSFATALKIKNSGYTIFLAVPCISFTDSLTHAETQFHI